MKKAFLYWWGLVTEDAVALHHEFQRTSNGTKDMILVAFLGALAAIFQSAGGLMPGVGFLISPFAAAPIQLGIVYSFRCGFMSYGVTVVLLLIIQPSELAVFPFTTGLLGICIGTGFLHAKNRIGIAGLGTIGLCAGIYFLMYLLHFPVLGPASAVSFHVRQFALVCLFCFCYSWLWVEFTLFGIRKIRRILEIRK